MRAYVPVIVPREAKSDLQRKLEMIDPGGSVSGAANHPSGSRRIERTVNSLIATIT